MRPQTQVRARLVEALEADLAGTFLPPDYRGSGQQVLQLPSSRWYLTGFLTPQAGRQLDVDDEAGDEPPAGSVAGRPIGLSDRGAVRQT